MYKRLSRIEETIRREISVILQEEINDPEIKLVTVTKIEVSRDLEFAKIFCIIFTDREEEKRNIMKALKRASGFIRGELGRRVSMRFIPRISFVEDFSESKKENIENILEKIKMEKTNSE